LPALSPKRGEGSGEGDDIVNGPLLFSQILNGLATGMLYALMGIGLSIITGVLNIPNFAHGALFALGAYFLYTLIQLIGNFWLALLLAPLGVGLLGVLIEYGGIRPLYKAGHDYQLLLTFGLSLIVTESIIIVWSPVGMSQLPPPILRGGVDLGITFYPKYRLFVMGSAALLVLGAWLFLEKTRYGAIMRAGIEDKEMVALLGIDIHRLFTAAFALGCVLAGIAGALTAPIRGLNPWMGVDMLGIAFVVVALAGLGNLLGSIAAGLLVGLAQSLVALVWPEASVAVIFAVMAAVLLVRPQGLFGIR
jgi:branched-chain amino acid transport system permease protein